MHGRFKPHDVVGGIVEYIGDDVMALPFDAVLIARTVEGSTDDLMAIERAKVPHTRIAISSFSIMEFTAGYPSSRREVMIDVGQFAATMEMKPLPMAGYIEAGDRLIVMIVDGLKERKPSALLGVGMDDIGREEISRVIHDDNFRVFIGHSNQGFGRQKYTR